MWTPPHGLRTDSSLASARRSGSVRRSFTQEDLWGWKHSRPRNIWSLETDRSGSKGCHSNSFTRRAWPLDSRFRIRKSACSSLFKYGTITFAEGISKFQIKKIESYRYWRDCRKTAFLHNILLWYPISHSIYCGEPVIFRQLFFSRLYSWDVYPCIFCTEYMK